MPDRIKDKDELRALANNTDSWISALDRMEDEILELWSEKEELLTALERMLDSWHGWNVNPRSDVGNARAVLAKHKTR